VEAIAAEGAVSFPWGALSRDLETVIEPATGGDPIAWLSTTLDHITCHPAGRSLVGSVGKHLYLIQLEGEPHSSASRRTT
jgi:hypothetical protein